jgi:DNA-binding MarR family transcriptional regulator
MQPAESLEAAVEEVLLASRVIVGLAARTIPDPDEVTLAQFRALVLLVAHGELNASRLAELMGVDPSTTTRLCDRLEAKGLIQRGSKQNRREVLIGLTAAGAQLVDQATAKRRAELRKIVRKLPATSRAQLFSGLKAFREAAGELPGELAWSLGWTG